MAVVGAGRIGALHARNIAGAVDGAVLVAAVDAIPEAAQRVAVGGAYATSDLNEVLADPAVEAVLIASPTPLHAEQIAAAAAAEKAIFCEKPVALELGATLTALDTVRAAGVPFQIGFNRRYDPGYAEVARAVHAGELGQVEMVRSQSTDPATPPESYVAMSGGIFRDSVIHDIDIARFVAGDVARVTALGRVLVEPYIGNHDDVDTSIVTLEFTSGALGVLQNSRRTVYGHDLRLEVHGERGKLVSEVEPSTAVRRYGIGGVTSDYVTDFMERFRDAYRLELQAFVEAVRAGTPPSPGPEAAAESLRVALAAGRSLREGRPVEVAEITA